MAACLHNVTSPFGTDNKGSVIKASNTVLHLSKQLYWLVRSRNNKKYHFNSSLCFYINLQTGAISVHRHVYDLCLPLCCHLQRTVGILEPFD